MKVFNFYRSALTDMSRGNRTPVSVVCDEVEDDERSFRCVNIAGRDRTVVAMFNREDWSHWILEEYTEDRLTFGDDTMSAIRNTVT